MLKLSKIAATSAAMFVAATVSAFAACDGDTGTETVLGAASGAAVGGLASRSVAGAAIGGVAGGLIGNAIGQSNNREDCRREAQYYGQGQGYYEQQAPYAREDYRQQAYQPGYEQQRQDYALRRQEYERQRQAYYRRYPNASSNYYSNGYGQGYDNNSYSYPSYSQPPSRYSDYSDGR